MAAPRRRTLPDPRELERTWLASYPPGVPPTYRLPDVALTRFLDDAARDFPDRTALTVSGHETTFVELRDRVDRLATALSDAGIAAGDRVLVALPLGDAAPAVLFGLWRLGAVAVPIDPGTRPVLAAAVARDAEVAAAIGSGDAVAALHEQDAAPALTVVVAGDEWTPRGLLSRLPRPPLRRLVPGRSRDGSDGTDDGPAALADLLDGAGARTAPDPPAPSSAAVLAYRPRARELRGVVLTHANLVANAFQSRLWVPDIQAGRERVLLTDPLHLTLPLTLGLLTAVLAAATLVVVPDAELPKLARIVERERPTVWPTAPARLPQLLDDGRRDLTSLRVVVTGAAPTDPQVVADVERRTGGARVREGYGLAEASPLTHAQPVYGRVQPGSIGLPVTDTVAVVVDPDDLTTRLEPGEPGMLLVHGPQVAAGYWRRPEADAATFRHGWLVTGDLATVDAAGVFTIVGRADEVVRRDGELVAPRAIEAVLARHAGVARTATVAVGEQDGRPQLAAAVVRAKRSKVDADGLLAHCRAHLSSAAIPDRIELVDALPEDDAGEVDRAELQRQLTGR